jgi:hypothetical protein
MFVQDLGRRARLAGATLGAGLLLAIGLPAAPAGAATTTVSPTTESPWAEKAFDCSTAAAVTDTISFVGGPATPPSGSGSLKFDLTGKNDNFVDVLQNDAYKGTLLSDVTGMSYSTYVTTAGVSEAPAFGFGVDTNADGTWDEDVSFYPINNGPVTVNTWQTWTLASNSTVIVEKDNAQPVQTTWGAYQTGHPASKLSYIALAYGCAYSPTAGGVGYVDKLSLTLKTQDADVFDFEATAPPVKKTGGNGYRMVSGDGGIFTFGERNFAGSTGDQKLNSPIVGGATDISDYDGYWIVAADGGVFTFGAEFYGSLGGQKLSSTAAEIEPTPSGKGYFIALADGKVYTFGDANFAGDMSGKKLNKPIIGMSVTPTGKGYWLVGADGGIFNCGDAGFFGSLGDKPLNKPIIDIAPAVDNKGYYLLGADGGVFTFGSADFKGSTGDKVLNAPVVAMLVAPTGAGYGLAARDGGVFTFGAIDFLGSMGGTKLNAPVLDLIN